MYTKQFTYKLIISLFSILCFTSVIYAGENYQAMVKEGDVLLSINDAKAKPYKQGDAIKLMADDLVCIRSGSGVVIISSSVKDFSAQISEPLQCQALPKTGEEKGWFSSSKQAVGEYANEGDTATSLITLDGIEYFVFENSAWHKNSRTLPFKLQVIGSDNKLIKEVVSNDEKTILFVIPKTVVEDKNSQTHTLKITNKSGSEMLKVTRFSLKTTVIPSLLSEDIQQEVVSEESSSDKKKVLQYELIHQLALLDSNKTKLGAEHPETAESHSKVGLLSMQLGKNNEAIANLSSALNIRKKTLNENDIGLAQSYYDLGMAFEKMRAIKKAKTNKNKAIQLWEAKYSRNRGTNQTSASVVKEHDKTYYDKGNHTIVDILYGTDRKINENYQSLENFFTGERSTLHYGVAQISIPKTHTLGEMERPLGVPFFTKETIGKHIIVKQLVDMNSAEFIEAINNKLDNVKENDILVFIHGYNVSFADAIRRTAQLSYDLKFEGVPLTYSWPSKSETEEYLTDEASVQYTVPHLVTFLKDVIDNNKESKSKANIHIIGHSMGSRALSYAVKELSLVYEDEQLFKNIIFAAPDIDKDVFEVSVFPYVRKTAEKITLYASSEDKALIVSASMHGGERVGQGGDNIFIFEGLDTIDASGVDAGIFTFSHSYFSEKKLMVNDIRDLIYKSLPPSKRKTLVGKSKNELAYWGLKFE